MPAYGIINSLAEKLRIKFILQCAFDAIACRSVIHSKTVISIRNIL